MTNISIGSGGWITIWLFCIALGTCSASDYVKDIRDDLRRSKIIIVQPDEITPYETSPDEIGVSYER